MNIKDYMHLYLGCDCTTSGWGNATIKGIDFTNIKEPVIVRFKTPALHGGYRADAFPYDEVKPILRPLSDMTEEEAIYVFKYYFEKDYAFDWSGDTGSANFNPKKVTPTKRNALSIVVGLVPFLLSKHFDLFGLIKAGLAIDKTTIK